jgi:hypothetical protein
VENFNGWFQPLFLRKPFRHPGDVRRELRRLMKAVNEEHIHPRLGHRTATRYRRGKQLRKLPADFSIDGQKLPISVGKVSFIRLVTIEGHIPILGQRFKVGKRLKFQYVIATIYTQRKVLKVYHKGCLVKEFAYKLTVK